MLQESDDSGWPWAESLDAVTAAPRSHIVVFENERVRVIEVVISPGEKEPVHTHRWPGVMLIDGAARIRYFGEDDRLAFESPQRSGDDPEDAPPRGPATERTFTALRLPASPTHGQWIEPEGPHAVENIDRVPYHALRIELKDAANVSSASRSAVTHEGGPAPRGQPIRQEVGGLPVSPRWHDEPGIRYPVRRWRCGIGIKGWL